jgi:hypothetical protein
MPEGEKILFADPLILIKILFIKSPKDRKSLGDFSNRSQVHDSKISFAYY